MAAHRAAARAHDAVRRAVVRLTVFLTVDNLLNVLRQSSINAILALGQLMVIITAGIDLSIGSVSE